jgi:hypothetical protein
MPGSVSDSYPGPQDAQDYSPPKPTRFLYKGTVYDGLLMGTRGRKYYLIVHFANGSKELLLSPTQFEFLRVEIG